MHKTPMNLQQVSRLPYENPCRRSGISVCETRCPTLAGAEEDSLEKSGCSSATCNDGEEQSKEESLPETQSQLRQDSQLPDALGSLWFPTLSEMYNMQWAWDGIAATAKIAAAVDEESVGNINTHWPTKDVNSSVPKPETLSKSGCSRKGPVDENPSLEAGNGLVNSAIDQNFTLPAIPAKIDVELRMQNRQSHDERAADENYLIRVFEGALLEKPNHIQSQYSQQIAVNEEPPAASRGNKRKASGDVDLSLTDASELDCKRDVKISNIRGAIKSRKMGGSISEGCGDAKKPWVSWMRWWTEYLNPFKRGKHVWSRYNPT